MEFDEERDQFIKLLSHCKYICSSYDPNLLENNYNNPMLVNLYVFNTQEGRVVLSDNIWKNRQLLSDKFEYAVNSVDDFSVVDNHSIFMLHHSNHLLLTGFYFNNIIDSTDAKDMTEELKGFKHDPLDIISDIIEGKFLCGLQCPIDRHGYSETLIHFPGYKTKIVHMNPRSSDQLFKYNDNKLVPAISLVEGLYLIGSLDKYVKLGCVIGQEVSALVRLHNTTTLIEHIRKSSLKSGRK